MIDRVPGQIHERSILFRDVLAAFSLCDALMLGGYWVVFEFLGKFSLGHHCVLCASPGNEDRICGRSVDVLPWNHCHCERCGQPVVADQPVGVFCADCQSSPPLFDRARSPLRYAFLVDTALKALKFKRQLMYAPAFATILVPTLHEIFPHVDALVPVPLHRLRHATRGFNQAIEISRELASHTGLPINHQTRRVRRTTTQSGLSASKRRKNLRQAFAVNGALDAKYPLIIDDVITTGSTCDYLAAALLAAGAKSVDVLTVARASIKLLR